MCYMQNNDYKLYNYLSNIQCSSKCFTLNYVCVCYSVCVKVTCVVLLHKCVSGSAVTPVVNIATARSLLASEYIEDEIICKYRWLPKLSKHTYSSHCSVMPLWPYQEYREHCLSLGQIHILHLLNIWSCIFPHKKKKNILWFPLFEEKIRGTFRPHI